MQSRKKTLILHTNLNPEARSPITREGIDILNSIGWLIMDAFWMFGMPKIGLIFSIPTLITGWTLFYKERKRASNWINLSTNCWIFMNVLWMLSDTFPAQEAHFLMGAKAVFALGIVFSIVGMHQTRSITDAIAHYKKYKSLGDKRLRILK